MKNRTKYVDNYVIIELWNNPKITQIPPVRTAYRVFKCCVNALVSKAFRSFKATGFFSCRSVCRSVCVSQSLTLSVFCCFHSFLKDRVRKQRKKFNIGVNVMIYKSFEIFIVILQKRKLEKNTFHNK